MRQVTGTDREVGYAASCDGQCVERVLERLRDTIGELLGEHQRLRASQPHSSRMVGAHGRHGELDGAVNTLGSPAKEFGVLAADLAVTGASPVGHSEPEPSRAEIQAMVIATLANLTKYPHDILTPDAQLDEDLGIDSLKRVEIVTELLGQLGQVPADLQELGPPPLTIAELITLAAQYVGKVRDAGGAGERMELLRRLLP
jgi:acyl carrier protein